MVMRRGISAQLFHEDGQELVCHELGAHAQLAVLVGVEALKDLVLAADAAGIDNGNGHAAGLGLPGQAPRGVRGQRGAHDEQPARGIDGLFGSVLDGRGDALAKHDHVWLEDAAGARRRPRAVLVRFDDLAVRIAAHLRLLQTLGTGRVSKGRVGCVWEVDITVRVGLDAAAVTVRGVFGAQRTRLERLAEKGIPARIQTRQLLLKLVAVELRPAARADDGAEVAVQLNGWYLRVRLGVERVDILCDDGAQQAEAAHVAHRIVGGVGRGLVRGRPAEEAARPVALARLVAGEELVVEDGSVCLVDAVGAVDAAVVGQAGGDGEAGAGEDGRLLGGGSVEVAGERRGEEASEGGDGAGDGHGRRWRDGRRCEDVRVRNPQEWFRHLSRGLVVVVVVTEEAGRVEVGGLSGVT